MKKYDEQTEKLLNYLTGQVIKTLKADTKHRGKCVEPTMIRRILEELLEEETKKRNQNQTMDSKSTDQV